ncbi:MAG: hypothetical protein Q8N63_07130 [Nanoarchaeota archaeon]|nr:hypothetical protein [Nanoarchaeota archaeon]
MKKRAEMNSRKILFIGIISLIMISVSVSLMSALTNFTSPVYGGNYSTTLNITIRVDANGINNITNISCYVNSSGGYMTYNTTFLLVQMINTTSGQLVFANESISISSINSATYNISCLVQNKTDVNTLNMTLGRVIRVDNTYPVNLAFGTGTEVDYANLSQSHIYINITNATENWEKNITFKVFYSNGSVASTTTYTNNSMYTRSVNITSLADGSYKYNVTVCDYSNNCNTTAVININLDNVNPAVTCTCSPLTATSSGTITCTVNATDAISGIKTKSAGTPSMNYGTHTVTCTATDNAGRNGTATSNEYTIGGGSPSGGSGGGSSATKTYIPSASQLSSGYTNELKSNERVKLTIASQVHYVSVSSLTATSATINVASTPQTATLNIGETKKFDVTEDGYYDLSAKLNSIKANKADITIKSINEKIPAPAESVPSETAQAPSTATTGELPEETPTNLTWLWILGIIVVVLIVAWIVYSKSKHRK